MALGPAVLMLCSAEVAGPRAVAATSNAAPRTAMALPPSRRPPRRLVPVPLSLLPGSRRSSIVVAACSCLRPSPLTQGHWLYHNTNAGIGARAFVAWTRTVDERV